LEKIFEPFEESTKTGAGGRSIGLSVCTAIIKAHNGKIWAKNNKLTFRSKEKIKLQ